MASGGYHRLKDGHDSGGRAPDACVGRTWVVTWAGTELALGEKELCMVKRVGKKDGGEGGAHVVPGHMVDFIVALCLFPFKKRKTCMCVLYADGMCIYTPTRTTHAHRATGPRRSPHGPRTDHNILGIR